MNTSDNEHNVSGINQNVEGASKCWEMNYLEAAIFLEEGENNDKFDSHPRNPSALPAYMITHNHWFYALDLFAALTLLLLATMERPAIEIFKDIPIGVHTAIELFALIILGISIALQIRWLGWKTFLKHKRSLSKCLLWLVMVMEAFSVLLRNSSHFRVTRALRPIFLVDNRYFGGVRRLLRQILQSLPPILEVLGLLFFTLLIFVVFGFYLFSSNKEDPYFSTFHVAFVSLYVLLTTANFPDVMMPSYAKSRWSALFFIAYLAITLYFIMNLMLAIVFVEFSIIEKDKFRKLFLHKREACQQAFQLLISHSKPNRITFKHFEGLMRFYRPKASRKSVYLLFKVLNRSRSGLLSLKEFYGIYDALEYRWRVAKKDQIPWFDDLYSPIRVICYRILRLVEWMGFKVLVYGVIITSALIILFRTILYSSLNGDTGDLKITWDQLCCIIFYIVEIILKQIAFGCEKYFSSGWNVFDFLVTSVAIGGVVAAYFNASFYFVLILRPLRLLQLFKFRRRYRDIFQTLAILLPRILSTIIVIIIIYYFFAIVGIECFSSYDMKNCCVNTTVEQYYKVDSNTIYGNYYYLNNFDTLLISGVTLFELTVVNNWFIIMEGYASVSGEWSRMYFMIFYLVMMVVLSIVVAFVIEAFTFRKGYNEAFKDGSKGSDDIKMYVTLTKEELDYIYLAESDVSRLQDYVSFLNQNSDIEFEGVRRRTKFVLQRRMYGELLSSWRRENDGSTLNHHCLLTENTFPIPSSTSAQRHPSESAASARDGDSPVCSDIKDDSDEDPLLITESVNLEEVFGSQVEVDGSYSLLGNDDPFFPSTIRHVPNNVGI